MKAFRASSTSPSAPRRGTSGRRAGHAGRMTPGPWRGQLKPPAWDRRRAPRRVSPGPDPSPRARGAKAAPAEPGRGRPGPQCACLVSPVNAFTRPARDARRPQQKSGAVLGAGRMGGASLKQARGAASIAPTSWIKSTVVLRYLYLHQRDLPHLRELSLRAPASSTRTRLVNWVHRPWAVAKAPARSFGIEGKASAAA